MRQSLRPCSAWTSAAILAVGVVLPVLVDVSPARAYTPKSPEVKSAIKRAVTYLLSDDEGTRDTRLGARCLMGITLLKYGTSAEDPRIQAVMRECVEASSEPAVLANHLIYSHALSIIFLCELDARKYQSEIDTLLALLVERQKPHGGWGYDEKPTGDTSMTQYAVLATWTARQSGIEISNESAAKVLNWLIRTQDPSGAWGYQGQVAESGTLVRIPQPEVRLSLLPAGAGSVYISADVLGLSRRSKTREKSDLPPGLKRIRDSASLAGRTPLTDRVNRAAMRRSMTDGNRFYQQNFRVQVPKWTHYYLYALERYMSFRELDEGGPVTNPNWYDAGTLYLLQTQQKNGAWEGGTGMLTDTAFGTLFLMRGTRKTLEKAGLQFGTGRLTGGRGLPKPTGKLHVQQGQIRFRTIEREFQDIISLMESGDETVIGYAGAPLPTRLSHDKKERSLQIARLEKVLRRGLPDSRLVAVRLIATDRDLNNASMLIDALRDDDMRVVLNAHNGLRRMRRSLSSSSLSKNSTSEEVATAAGQWRQWYRSIRPDADILE